MSIFNWIDSDVVLLNAFINFLRTSNSLEVAKICLVKEYHGMIMMRVILKKTQTISSKPPHTETHLTLLKNLLDLLASLSNVIDVRQLLKKTKIFEMLDILHPQLQRNRKTTWNVVTVLWLKFFEALSLLEDTECNMRWDRGVDTFDFQKFLILNYCQMEVSKPWVKFKEWLAPLALIGIKETKIGQFMA